MSQEMAVGSTTLATQVCDLSSITKTHLKVEEENQVLGLSSDLCAPCDTYAPALTDHTYTLIINKTILNK